MKAVAAIVAILFFALAVGYWTGSIQLLANHPGPHHSHALLCAGLGVLALVWLRFQSAAPVRR